MKTIEVVFVCDPPSVTSQSLVEDSTSSTIPLLPSKCVKGHECFLPSVPRGKSSLNYNCLLNPNMGKLPHSISSGSQYT